MMFSPQMQTDFLALWKLASEAFKLDLGSIHGLNHWNRVEGFALQMAKINGADQEIARIFAIIHDCKRENENYDPQHGLRAAILAREINDTGLFLNENRLEILCFALENHDKGEISNDATIGTCWDADRLDLGRVGVAPKLQFFSTGAGKLLLKTGRI